MNNHYYNAVLCACILALAGNSVKAQEAQILTPPAPDTPRINGPGVFGVRPGSPFLYAIPATGKRPMAFRVAGLPTGLKLPTQDGGSRFAVRDLWRQKDIGVFQGNFETKVPPHGVVLVRLIPAK